jgi:hypothetical protein
MPPPSLPFRTHHKLHARLTCGRATASILLEGALVPISMPTTSACPFCTAMWPGVKPPCSAQLPEQLDHARPACAR